jgi:hypothetical protein
LGLAALIAAYHESAEPGRLRAALPLAGRTVVERQVRLAVAAGASPVLVLAERMPADLAAAIERMRREHLPVRLVRGAEEASEAIEAGDRLLLIADGAIADGATLAALAVGEGPAVLTVADTGHGEIYERIDAHARWAGAAALDGALLHSTVAMLRDWDLQSTLLRRILQAAARQVMATGPVAILDASDDLEALERQILAAANAGGAGWAERLLAPIERALASLLIASPLAPGVPGYVALLLTFAGAAAFAMHWLWTGLALTLVATPLDGAAARLARVRMQGDPAQSWWRHVLPYASALGLFGLATSLAPVVGWGMVPAAAATIAFLIAQGIERRGQPPGGALFLAEPKGMSWLLLPFAAFGQWAAGIAVLAGYAVASFFHAQRQAHRHLPRNGTIETG